MRTHDRRTVTIVDRRVERLGRLPGRRIECLSGAAWLTIDGDMRDVVLLPGESFEVDRDAPVRVCALSGAPAQIDLGDPGRGRRSDGRMPFTLRVGMRSWLFEAFRGLRREPAP